MNLAKKLKENGAEIMAELFNVYHKDLQITEFHLSLFVPTDRVLRFVADSVKIPVVKLGKLSVFKDIILNHHVIAIDVDHNEIISINNNTFAFNGMYLDDNARFTIKKKLKVDVNGQMVDVYIINGLLVTDEQKAKLQSTYLETLPYDLFLKLVETGEIRGKDLINLCNTSTKLQLYCTDRNEALFRKLIKSEGINPRAYPDLSARDLYRAVVIGGNVDIIDLNNIVTDLKFPIGIINISIGNAFILLLDNNNLVWKYIPGGQTDEELDIGGRYNITPQNMKFPKLELVSDIKFKYISAGNYYTNAHLIDMQGVLYRMLYNITTGIISIDKYSDEAEFIAVDSSTYHTLCLDNEGQVWTKGDNSKATGRSLTTTKVFDKIQGFGNKDNEIFIIAIAASRSSSGFTLMLDNTGFVWSFGNNSNGQLGFSNKANRQFANKIPNLNKIIAISAGAEHSLVLDSNGIVWGFGSNTFGATGSTTKSFSYKPSKVIIPHKKIVSICAGNGYSLLLTNDGDIYRVGNNSYDPRNMPLDKHIPVKLDLDYMKGRVFKIFAGYDDVVVLWQ